MTLQVKIAHAIAGYPSAAIVQHLDLAGLSAAGVIHDGGEATFLVHQGTALLVVERTEDGRQPATPYLAKFKYGMGQKVKIQISGEHAEVIGRAEYASIFVPQYQLRYVNAAGSACECWWSEDTLDPA